MRSGDDPFARCTTRQPPGDRGSPRDVPAVPQVAVFDTAFHQTMPPRAFHYALPRDLYDAHRVRRYGFHGTSHAHVARRAAELLRKPPRP